MRRETPGAVRWLRARWEPLKRDLNTPAGMIAFFGGLCLGLLLRMCWALALLHLDQNADHQIEYSVEAFLMGVFSGFLVIVMLILFWVKSRQPSTVEYTPPRGVLAKVVAGTALYIIISFSISEQFIR